MALQRAITEGVREVWFHGVRSFIAILALVCGVGSLLATFALVEGAAASERRFLLDWGGVEKFYVSDRPLPPEQETRRGMSPGKTVADVEAIRRAVPLARYAAAHTVVEPPVTVTYGKKRIDGPPVYPCDPTRLLIDNYKVSRGRLITDLDVANSAQVCVIATGVSEKLGLEPDPVGKSILLQGSKFQVVGVIRKSEVWFKNLCILIPLSTGQQLFRTPATESDPERNDNLMLKRIAIQVHKVEDIDRAIDQIRSILQVTHLGVQDFGFDTLQDLWDEIESRIAAMRLTGNLTAIVSLIVGGIGITNVMLSSIKQRVREIGIRRALGARSSDIFLQILTETALLAVAGGLLGLGAGFGLIKVLSLAVDPEAMPIVTPTACAISFAAALVVGLGAGIYPAIRGSNVSPNEALRYE